MFHRRINILRYADTIDFEKHDHLSTTKVANAKRKQRTGIILTFTYIPAKVFASIMNESRDYSVDEFASMRDHRNIELNRK